MPDSVALRRPQRMPLYSSGVLSAQVSCVIFLGRGLSVCLLCPAQSLFLFGTTSTPLRNFVSDQEAALALQRGPRRLPAKASVQCVRCTYTLEKSAARLFVFRRGNVPHGWSSAPAPAFAFPRHGRGFSLRASKQRRRLRRVNVLEGRILLQQKRDSSLPRECLSGCGSLASLGAREPSSR